MRASAKLVRSAPSRKSTCCALLLPRGASAVTMLWFCGSGADSRDCAAAPKANSAANVVIDSVLDSVMCASPRGRLTLQVAYHAGAPARRVEERVQRTGPRLGSGLFCGEAARGGRESPHEIPFLGQQQRIPKIEDQHDAQLVAVVARLMLDRVVEDQRLADVPTTPIEAYAVAASLGHDEQQVRDYACVGLTVVRRNARFRRERGEHGVRAKPVDVCERHRRERACRLGASRKVLFD